MLHYRTGLQSADDPLEYVLSDETVDRYGDVIAVDGWKLANFKKNPIALFNHDSDKPIGTWDHIRVDAGRLIARLKLAATGTSIYVDDARKLIEQRVLRAVSVGFRPLKTEPLEGGGAYAERYLESELVECSICAVPANPNALQITKALGIPASRAALFLGKPANEDQTQRRSASPGKPAQTPLRTGGNPVKNTLAKQIETAEGERNALQDKLLEITETEDRSAEDEVLLGNLPGEIESLDGQIKTLKSAERALALRSINTAAETDDNNNDDESKQRGSQNAKRPFAVPAKKLQPRDLLVRGAAIQLMAHINKVPLMEMTKRMYGDDESTSWLMKAVTNPAMTTVPGWAQELVMTGIADFLNTLPVDSIYRPLSAMGARFTFGRNGVIRVPARTSTPNLSGAFIGEGQPIPVRRLGLTSVSLTPRKMGVISTFTRELAAHSTPSIESIIRDAMADDTAITIDTTLLDNAAATAIRPAGLLNGVVALPPSAATDPASAMVADIKALISAITASRGGRAIAILINPAQGIGINFVQTATGEFLFGSASEAGTRLGVTFLSSPNVPLGEVIAVDAADFASATGDVPEYDVSDQATIHEEDTTPLPIVAGGTAATPVRSLWQTASIGVRMLLDINWAMRRTGMVQFISGVTW